MLGQIEREAWDDKYKGGNHREDCDFGAEIAPNGQILVPPEIASQVPTGEKVAVVCQLGSAYEDSIYELLIHHPPSR
jgi:hypothetical protein